MNKAIEAPTAIKITFIRNLLGEALSQLDAIEKQEDERRAENDFLKHNPIPSILSPKLIAGHCGVSYGTVSEWLITGTLKGTKKGGRWLIKREDFIAWLDEDEKPKLAKAR